MTDSNLPDNPNEQARKSNWEHYSHSAYLKVNKAAITAFGIETAVFLSYLISEEMYFGGKDALDEDGSFFRTESNREIDTGLSLYQQSKAIDVLVENEILFPVIRKGNPPRQRFKFDHIVLQSFLNFDIIENLRMHPKNFKEHNTIRSNSNDNVIKDTEVSLSDSPESLPKTNRFQRLAPIPEPNEDSPKEVHSDYVRPGDSEYAVLMSWNKLPTPACLHKLNTKTVKRAVEYIGQLKNGVFGNPARRQFNVTLLNRHKIDLIELSKRKFPIREICRVIEGPFANMFKEGYWPKEKSSLPKSLPDFLYNPRTQWSFFLQCVYNPPGLLKNPLPQDPHPDITKALIKEGFSDLKNPSAFLWNSYLEGITQFRKYLDEINWNNSGARQMFPYGKQSNPYNLVMQYVSWIKGEADPHLLEPPSVPDRLTIGMLRPIGFWKWQKFMEAVNRYWGRVFKNVVTPEDN